MSGVVFLTDHVFSDIDVIEEILGSADYQLDYRGNIRDQAEMLDAARDADAIITCFSPVSGEVISGLTRCRAVARLGVGVDNIDVAAATKRGIQVTNIPDYCVDEVSDHAIALVLALGRRLAKLDRSVREGTWQGTVANPLYRLRGRVLGVIGFGRIGQVVAEKALAIGLRVLACDPSHPASAFLEAGVEKRDLDVLLADSHFVSLHAPLTDETRHLIGESELLAMRTDAFLINTARGGLVDTAALRRALEQGWIAGAGLDVLEAEPPEIDEAVLRHPDVIATPHVAFYSEESLAELQRRTAEQLVATLAGERPENLINPAALEARAATRR